MPVDVARATGEPTSSMPRVYPVNRPERAGAGTLERMRRQRLDSRAIAAVGYSPETAVLELEFVSGEVYRYYAVPPSVHRALMASESAGRYFRDHIREVYPAEHRR